MGAPMAGHLLAKGFRVTGCDPAGEARQDAVSQGVTVLDSPGEAARASDLAIIVVGFEHEVETAVFGKGGIVDVARRGLVVDADRMRAALRHSSAQNWAMDNRADLSGMPWAEKDMSIVLQEADLARLSLPLCGSVRETIKGLKIRLGLGLPRGAE